MTAIKQTSVTERKHLSNLREYLDWGNGKSLGHGSLNIVDEARWDDEMDATREAYGHNVPGKAGAKCTYMQHQVLAFNPDECDLNGGMMDPSRCLEYAREYVQARYPFQEVVWVLHREHCRADGTDRYAIHIGINRTNLATGLRLDEGPARKAALARVATVRDMDARYGLAQLEKGRRNSNVHARQPSVGERMCHDRGGGMRTENDLVRAAVAKRVQEVSRLPGCSHPERELARRLRADGIELARAKEGDLQYRYRSQTLGEGRGGIRKINGSTLGEVRNRRSGRAIRLDRAALSGALRLGRLLVDEMERDL